MMCFGSAGVHPTSPAQDWNGVELFEDRVIPYLAEFADTMHAYDVPDGFTDYTSWATGTERGSAAWDVWSLSCPRTEPPRNTPHTR